MLELLDLDSYKLWENQTVSNHFSLTLSAVLIPVSVAAGSFVCRGAL